MSTDVGRVIDVVCAVIESDDGLVLACQRADDRHLGGLWEFPGGKVEDGESANEALVREIREELDIEIQTLSELRPVVWEYEERTIQLHPYRCKIVSGEPRALEHKEIAWSKLEELDQYEWAGADLTIVRELMDAVEEG